LLQASLEQSAHINLLDQGKAGDILQNMTKPADTPITEPIGREIALRANAARVIFAQVTGSQGHYTLKVDIQRPDYTNPQSNSETTGKNPSLGKSPATQDPEHHLTSFPTHSPAAFETPPNGSEMK
jgi:hypothetical protein